MPQETIVEDPEGKRIRSVVGTEPRRENEYPMQMAIGWAIPTGTTEPPPPKIARIVCHEQNFGTYGILWYIAYDEDGSELMRMNALSVAEVYYEEAKYGATSN